MLTPDILILRPLLTTLKLPERETYLMAQEFQKLLSSPEEYEKHIMTPLWRVNEVKSNQNTQNGFELLEPPDMLTRFWPFESATY